MGRAGGAGVEQANGLRVVSDRRIPASPARIEARFKRNAAFSLLQGKPGEGGMELPPDRAVAGQYSSALSIEGLGDLRSEFTQKDRDIDNCDALRSNYA